MQNIIQQLEDIHDTISDLNDVHAELTESHRISTALYDTVKNLDAVDESVVLDETSKTNESDDIVRSIGLESLSGKETKTKAKALAHASSSAVDNSIGIFERVIGHYFKATGKLAALCEDVEKELTKSKATNLTFSPINPDALHHAGKIDNAKDLIQVLAATNGVADHALFGQVRLMATLLHSLEKAIELRKQNKTTEEVIKAVNWNAGDSIFFSHIDVAGGWVVRGSYGAKTSYCEFSPRVYSISHVVKKPTHVASFDFAMKDVKTIINGIKLTQHDVELSKKQLAEMVTHCKQMKNSMLMAAANASKGDSLPTIYMLYHEADEAFAKPGRQFIADYMKILIAADTAFIKNVMHALKHK
jgi:hypothetical protein